MTKKSKPKIILEVTEMRVTEVTITCPHCSSIQDGFIGNPQGNTFECYECQGMYKVHSEADPEMLD
jgi:hypothetical protein